MKKGGRGYLDSGFDYPPLATRDSLSVARYMRHAAPLSRAPLNRCLKQIQTLHKTAGWAPSGVQAFRPLGLPHEPSPSTFVLRGIESILYPQSYCPCAPLPATLQLRFRRLSFERVRTPHHAALSNAPSAYRPLDDGCRGWRNQHGITGRQLPRRLLLPGQRCEGRLGGRNPPDPAE